MLKELDYTDYFYDFLVDYDGCEIDAILDIHKYLMKKQIQNNIQSYQKNAYWSE